MKEMIYNEKETNNSDEIRVPKNIRQIGDASKNRKIYIEDYVISTIKKKNDNDSMINYGVLLGEIKRNREETCIFINGLVESREIIENSIIFNDEIWADIYKDINHFYEGLQIVGWYVSSSYISGKEMKSINKLHIDHFAGNDKVCFLCDRNEKEEQAYIYENGELKKQSGFYIYYEKNDRVKKYLKQTAGERGVNISAKESISNKGDVQENNYKNVKEEESGKSAFREIVRQYVDEGEKKGIRSKLSFGLSSILIIALLLSTIVMLNNYGELKNLKYSIDTLNNSDNVKEVNEILSSILPEKQEESQKDNSQKDNSQMQSNQFQEEETNPQSRIEDEDSSIDQNQSTANDGGESITNKSSQTGGSIYSGMYHTVKKGQTLYDISVSYYGTGKMVEQIKAMNGIDDDYVIKEGQKILLP